MARWTKRSIMLVVAIPSVGLKTAHGHEFRGHVAFYSPVPFARASSKEQTSTHTQKAAHDTISSVDSGFRSRHWIDDDFFLQPMGLDFDDDLLSDSTTIRSSSEPVVTTMHRNKDGNVVSVEVESALMEWEAAVVQALAVQVRNQLGDTQFEHRSFGDGKGGNDCTYLAPLLQALRPDIPKKVMSIVRLAWEEADWGAHGYPDPLSLGIRTSEHLSYRGWKSLEAHKDIGSIYTTMMAIADPNNYDGGEFFVQTSFLEQTDIKPTRLSAIVFLSDTTHGVRSITAGRRESFVTELWNHDDAPLGMNRPTPEEWEEFMDKQQDT